MAKVTGILADYQLGFLQGKNPTISFQPSGPSLSNAAVHAPERATVAPVGSTGYFEVDLQPTDGLRPARHYTVTLQWGQGKRVVLPWKLRVPAGGGILSELLPVDIDPGLTWIGEEPPPTTAPNLLWLKPSTGELLKWSD